MQAKKAFKIFLESLGEASAYTHRCYPQKPYPPLGIGMYRESLKSKAKQNIIMALF